MALSRPGALVLGMVLVAAACATGARPSLVDPDPAGPTVASAPGDATTAPAPGPTSAGPGGSSDAATGTGEPETPPPAPDGRSYPVLPDDPDAIARELVIVERALRDPATPEGDLPDLGHRQQVIYRVLGRHLEWDEAVFAALPADLVADVTSHLGARRAFIDLVAPYDPPTMMPAWAIVEPEPAEVLLTYYREAEAATGIEWEYLAAINLVETGMGRIVGLSTAGAQGPMQFIPSTWEEVGEGSIDDPHDSIQAAARYLVRRGGPADMDAALFGYNNADEYVEAVSHYAELFRRDERNLVGPYHWEIHFFGETGDLWLPVGYRRAEPQPIADYERSAPWSVPPPGVIRGDR